MKITDELSRRISELIENYAAEHASDPPERCPQKISIES
jgi:hypothetical protein